MDSDEDIEHLVHVVEGPSEIDSEAELDLIMGNAFVNDPSEIDSEAELDLVCQLVEENGRSERFVQQGYLLAQHMRLHKSLKFHKSKGPVIAPHVIEKVDFHNAEFAKTKEDIIDPTEKKPIKIRGKGQWKVWIPEALQRACWGIKPWIRIAKKTEAHRILKGQTAVRHMPAPTAMSTRMYQVFTRSSGTHIQAVRAAMCELYMREQAARLRAEPRARIGVLEVAFDETEEPVMLDVTTDAVHTLTCHVKLFRRFADNSSSKIELVCPPACMHSTSAEDIKGALEKRLPISLGDFRNMVDQLFVPVNTDSAPSCLRFVRHLQQTLAALSAPCRMHQGVIGLTAPLQHAGLQSSVFCAILLVRRYRMQRKLRNLLRKHLADNFEILFEDVSQEHHDQVYHLLSLMKDQIKQRLTSDEKPSQRLQALRRLQRFLVGPLSDGKFRHVCKFGCHTDADSALAELDELMRTVFFDDFPCVPAFNKWLKIDAPVIWLAVLSGLHHLLPRLLEHIFAQLDSNSEALEFSMDDLIAIDDAKSFQRKEQAYLRKTQGFLSSELVQRKLLSCAMSMRTVFSVLSAGFVASRRYAEPRDGILPFVHESTNPAKKAIDTFFGFLRDQDSPFWLPLSSQMSWCEEQYVLGSKPVWLHIGHLIRRLVIAIRCKSMQLGRLVGDECTEAQKRVIAQGVIDACQHSDPFLLYYRRGLASVDDVLSPANLQNTADIFRNYPVSNIISESSFASSKMRRSHRHGKVAKAPTLASDHVLAAAKTSLDVAAEEQKSRIRSFQMHDVKALSRWHEFVIQSRHWASMEQLSAEWRAMTDEEKAHFEPQTRSLPSRILVEEAAPDVWPHVSDGTYPVRTDRMGDLSKNISRYAEAWEKRIGNVCLPPAAPLVVPIRHDCEYRYGGGYCVDCMPSALKTRHDSNTKRFDRWASIYKLQPVICDKLWTSLELFFIGPDVSASASSEADLHGILVMMIFPYPRRQIFHRQDCAPPAAGQTIHLQVSFESLVDHASLAWDWQASWTAYHIKCTQVGLLAYAIEELEIMSKIELAHAEMLRSKRNEEKKISSLLADFDKAAKKRKVDPDAVKVPHGASSHPPPPDESLPLPDSPLDEFDKEIEAAPSDDEDLDDLGMLDVGLFAEAVEDLPHLDDDCDPGDDAADSGSSETVEYNATNGRVTLGGENLGRITIVREGLPSAAISLYCRRHGCAILKGIAKCPGLEEQKRWFLLGQDIPVGRSAALQRRHKALFGTS